MTERALDRTFRGSRQIRQIDFESHRQHSQLSKYARGFQESHSETIRSGVRQKAKRLEYIFCDARNSYHVRSCVHWSRKSHREFIICSISRLKRRVHARLTENAARESRDVYNYASELQIRDVWSTDRDKNRANTTDQTRRLFGAQRR